MNMGIMVNSKRQQLTGPEIAGYIADMLPEMSRMARDRNMANLADLLDSALAEARRCKDAQSSDNVIRLS
jgi:hypothetical protein